MPSRVQVHTGTAAPPRQAPSTVNEVVNALQRKLNSNHIDPTTTSPNISPKPSRRSSFSMENFLHPHHKKDKNREDSGERDARGQKRISLNMRHSSKSKDRVNQSPKQGPVRPARFENIIESPPLVLYGSINSSTGALLSGRLKLDIDDASSQVTLESFVMVLQATTATKKPVGKDCKDCIDKHEELKKWTFLSEPKTFHKDRDNQFPYSFLFPGHLPATTQSQLAAISYALHVTAKTSHGEKIEYHHPLNVQRAIQPGPEKASIRIFPPTNLTGRVQLPPIVHPIGTFPVKMCLSGVVEKKVESQTRWRLRKLSWRIEEHSKVISSPCTKHAHKVQDGKSIQHSETRTLGNDELKTGWKSDFDTVGGEINVEFEASLATKSSYRASCDVDSNTGVEVKHNLVLELIVAEEFCPNKNTQLVTPTGAARVLRMQFALIVTERAGMGISWDEEMPPVYDDVPASPPGYGSADKTDGAWGGAMMEDYHGPELEYEDLDIMVNDDPNAPPSYRQSRAPMATRRSSNSDDAGESSSHPTSSSRPHGRWTNDELGYEPQYTLRTRRESDQDSEHPAEDYGEGSSAHATGN